MSFSDPVDNFNEILDSKKGEFTWDVKRASVHPLRRGSAQGAFVDYIYLRDDEELLQVVGCRKYQTTIAVQDMAQTFSSDHLYEMDAFDTVIRENDVNVGHERRF